MQLRPYQQASVDAVWRYLRECTGNPCVVLPTGAGKTPVLAHLTRQAVEEWGGRVLILAHVRELLQQACEKLRAVWPMAPLGLYSAGLGARTCDTDIVVAGIQSAYNKADKLGRFDLIIVDEAHLIPPSGDGMYRSLLADLLVINPAVRLIGLTATPYRLGTGMICGPDNLLNDVCYEVMVRDLIEGGFLCRLRGKAGEQADLSGVHVRGGEYIAGELEDALADEETVARAADEMVATLADRRSWIVFCSGVKHAGMVLSALAERHVAAELVTGETSGADRAKAVARFQAGELRAMVNVACFTTGFDAPNVDAVVLLRPTLSPGLYYQMVGRGLRMHPSKKDCMVLDFAGCIAAHGPIDRIEVVTKEKREAGEAPTKNCPACKEIVLAGVAVCPACGHEFPRPVVKHEAKAMEVSPLAAPMVEETWEVADASYIEWKKKGADEHAPRTLCVTYHCGPIRSVREWVCLEHPAGSYAHRKAIEWWRLRAPAGSFMPNDAGAAARAIMSGAIPFREPSSIVVRIGGKYPEIVRCVFAAPCSSCVHYDAGHCMRWGADVPHEARSAGCQEHKPIAEYASVPDSDEVPF